MAFRFFKAELALLQSSNPGCTEGLAPIQLSEAGLDQAELIKLTVNADVPKPANSLRKTVRRAKNTFKIFAASHREGVTPRESEGHAIPPSLVQELLSLLDLRDVYRTPFDDARRRPVKPCPFAAQELYDRLLLARRHAWCIPVVPKRVLLLGDCGGASRSEKGSNTPRWYITNSELSGLVEPVTSEMRACLEYVESFCRFLEATAVGRRRDDNWVGLSELRTCVFKLVGFWPRGVEKDYQGCAFDLPSDLSMLLYPQVCLDRDEMVENLEEIVLGPGWDSLRRLEVISCGP